MELSALEIYQRKLVGLSVVGYELPEVQPLKTDANDRERFLYEQAQQFREHVKNLQEQEALANEDLHYTGTYPGSFEARIKLVKAAVSAHSMFKDDKHYYYFDVIATYEGEAYVFEHENKKYYLVAYDVTDAGGIVVTSIKEMEPRLVAKEHLERHLAGLDVAPSLIERLALLKE